MQTVFVVRANENGSVGNWEWEQGLIMGMRWDGNAKEVMEMGGNVNGKSGHTHLYKLRLSRPESADVYPFTH